VFHCAAGKDRTGIIAAVLLSLLGVSDDVIAQDYAHTAVVFPRMITRFIAAAQASDNEDEMALFNDPSFITKISSAEPAMILEALRGLRDDFGSIEGYLNEFGGDPGLPKALRHSLLTP
jgi:protein-tyrosine phosphatase